VIRAVPHVLPPAGGHQAAPGVQTMVVVMWMLPTPCHQHAALQHPALVPPCEQYGEERGGVGLCGVVQCGAVRCGAVRCGAHTG
jgi:hypothetical protein